MGESGGEWERVGVHKREWKGVGERRRQLEGGQDSARMGENKKVST